MWPTLEQEKLVDEKLGSRYGQMPPNWEKITESEYYWRWTIKPAQSIFQFRQVKQEEKPYVLGTYLFVHPGDFSGIGFYVEYGGGRDSFKPHYFKWVVCEHDAEVTMAGNCYREYRCRKCDYQWAVDSSG